MAQEAVSVQEAALSNMLLAMLGFISAFGRYLYDVLLVNQTQHADQTLRGQMKHRRELMQQRRLQPIIASMRALQRDILH